MLFGRFLSQTQRFVRYNIRKVPVKRGFLVFCLLLMVCTVFGADPAFKPGKPFTLPIDPAAYVLDDGSIVLRNRGSAASTAEYPDGAEVSFTWKWTEGNLEAKYPDHLCVAVLTDGVLRPQWSHEIGKGVVVRFNPGSGGITIEGWLAEKKEAESLASKDGFTFEKGKAYEIKILYTPTKVVVTVDGGDPVSADVPEKFRTGGKNICFYNREPVAGIVKSSMLTKVSVGKPPIGAR